MIIEQVSPGEAYQLCRYDWMREALTALLERFSMMEEVGSTQELTDQNGMYMMLQTTSDGAVALC
jgi:diphosphoinositol-polyphosphate diphosphatase